MQMQHAAADWVGRPGSGVGGEISRACPMETVFAAKLLRAQVSGVGGVKTAAAGSGRTHELLHALRARHVVAAGLPVERQAAAATPGGQTEQLHALDAGLVATGPAIARQAAAAAPGGQPEPLHAPAAGRVAAGQAIELQAAAAAPSGRPELLHALDAGLVAAGRAIELQAAAAAPGGRPELLHALDAGRVAAGQATELQAAAAAPGGQPEQLHAPGAGLVATGPAIDLQAVAAAFLPLRLLARAFEDVGQLAPHYAIDSIDAPTIAAAQIRRSILAIERTSQ